MLGEVSFNGSVDVGGVKGTNVMVYAAYKRLLLLIVIIGNDKTTHTFTGDRCRSRL